MLRRYAALHIVTGRVVNSDLVPLEAAILILDENMQPIDSYSSPIIPHPTYDISMVVMNSPQYLNEALDRERLWTELSVNAVQAEYVDRHIADKLDRHCDPRDYDLAVLCDKQGPVQEAMFRFLPGTAKRLERLNASWLEIEPLKAFAETERFYGVTDWKYRAMPRAQSVAQYAFHMRRAFAAGAAAATQQASQQRA